MANVIDCREFLHELAVVASPKINDRQTITLKTLTFSLGGASFERSRRCINQLMYPLRQRVLVEESEVREISFLKSKMTLEVSIRLCCGLDAKEWPDKAKTEGVQEFVFCQMALLRRRLVFIFYSIIFSCPLGFLRGHNTSFEQMSLSSYQSSSPQIRRPEILKIVEGVNSSLTFEKLTTVAIDTFIGLALRIAGYLLDAQVS